jgi:hypothetical protein
MTHDCPVCGFGNVDEAIFCGSCGRPLQGEASPHFSSTFSHERETAGSTEAASEWRRASRRHIVLLTVALLLAIVIIASVAYYLVSPEEVVAVPYDSFLNARVSSNPCANNPCDEQLFLVLGESFSSLTYNVTAVRQTDPGTGFGPGYLLNGLTESGYWYQVGLGYDWCCSNANSGFRFLEDIGTSQQVLPITESTLPGPVNEGDSVELSLSFNNANQVVMYLYDWNTGTSETTYFPAYGADSFVGCASVTSPPCNGQYFSGPMTELYRSGTTTSESRVVFTDKSLPKTSASMCVDEYVSDGTSQGQSAFFGCAGNSELSYSGHPAQLYGLSYGGAQEQSDAYEFVTGS